MAALKALALCIVLLTLQSMPISAADRGKAPKRKPSQEFSPCQDPLPFGDRTVKVVLERGVNKVVVSDLEPVVIHASGLGKECIQVHPFPAKKIIIVEFFKGYAGTKEVVEETALYVYKVKTLTPKEQNEMAQPATDLSGTDETSKKDDEKPQPKESKTVVELLKIIPLLIKGESDGGKKRTILDISHELIEEPNSIVVKLKDRTLGRDKKPKLNEVRFLLE